MIYKVRYTAFLLFISFISFGQVLPTEKSENHVQIEGTNIFMIPPTEFESSSNFKGFAKPLDQTSMIMAIEIPGPYAEITKGFDSEGLKARGMELKSKKSIKVNKFDGLLIKLDQAANGMIFSKLLLIYGNETQTTFINGVYLQDNTVLGEKIKESILTTVIDTNLEINPREALNYTIDEGVSTLKLHSVMGNAILFNRDLKTPTESPDKATLIVDKSFAKMAIQDKKSFCISRLKEYPENYNIIENRGINDIKIDELKGFELFAQTSDNATDEMYQVILFDSDNTYYIFVANYLASSKETFKEIQSIIKTFKRKK
ncbi:PsbP-related protein [uncultured Arcticibacterium sp.]|uniref:PsbP-related protein n=1 Tax=uncultured Arcticibacterium sp. TaxID=2173042 RepID=UPI0030F6BCCD